MKRKTCFFYLSFSLILLSCANKKDARVVTPNDIQLAWADAEIGVLFHLDMPTFKPDYNFRLWGTHPDAALFNPTALNTDQWMETARALGATYAVLVAKHCSGFSLWPTEAHDYSVKHSPWRDGKGDIVADFIASCKKYNIRPGIYASTTANGYLYVDNPGLVQPGAPVTQEEYNLIVERQLTELWRNYGELFEIWFDGGVLSKARGGADVLALVEKLQPKAIAFQGPYGHPNLIRWVGNEEGVAPYPCWATADSTTNADGTVVINGLNGDPFAPYWCPGESDFTLRWNRSFQGGWFWTAGQDSMMFTIDELMTKYITSVGRNTNMLLGVVIDDRGLIPDADVQQLTLFGNEIRRQYETPLCRTAGKGKEYLIRPEQPATIDRAVIQEDIAKGERVLSYRIEAKTDGEWKQLSTGTNIGHKHIDKFQPCTVSEIKLIVTEAKAEPLIKDFAVFTASEK
ncbi:MAG: alpha-L-fucosidase [Tannerella sp.]|jgi:alpha-L-fucosidase|nr:alpha-L-fucosidase [Tannerella sp.]